MQKFGGTSVGSAERIAAVAERVKESWRAGQRVVVVVSAMAGETDRLIDLAKSVSERPSGRELDVVLSTGEQVTIALLCFALEQVGVPSRSFTGAQIPILTDEASNKARILDIRIEKITEQLQFFKTNSRVLFISNLFVKISASSFLFARLPCLTLLLTYHK